MFWAICGYGTLILIIPVLSKLLYFICVEITSIENTDIFHGKEKLFHYEFHIPSRDMSIVFAK
jgi:hypothetical protein